MANYEYIGDGLYRGLAADTKPSTPVQQAIAFEIDTRKTYYYQSGTWTEAVSAGAGGTATDNPFTWYIYKVGTSNTYKAKNGPLGTSPTTIGAVANPNSSLDALWGAIRSNFNLGGEETNLTSGAGAGGLITFGRGVYTFTDEILIDPTMTGGARAPAIQGQSKGGTIIKLAPTSAKTSGIHVKSMVEPILRDLDIWVEDQFVTTNIVHVDAMSAACAGGLFENIRIFKSLAGDLNAYFPTTPPAGQRGFYLQQGTNNTTNTMHFAQFRKILIKDTEKGFDSVGIGNNSFMTFDGIYLWRSKQGFTGDVEFKQSHLSNFIMQAANSGAYGDYCISLSGPANTVCNVTTDVIDNATAGVVILQPGARLNRLYNIVNSGTAPDILDFSGSDTNYYQPYYNTVPGSASNSVAGMTNNKVGDFLGDSITLGTGLLATTGITTTSTGTGVAATDPFAAAGMDATTIIGQNVPLTTDSAANSPASIRSTRAIVRRRWNPTFTAKWKLNTGSGTTIRFFIGLYESPTFDFDDLLLSDGAAGIGIGKAAGGDTLYKIFRGDTTTAPAAGTNALTTGGSSITADANPHQMWLHINDARNTAYISIDNHMAQTFTSEIPGPDDPLYMIAYLESVSGAAKVMNLSRMSIRMSR